MGDELYFCFECGTRIDEGAMFCGICSQDYEYDVDKQCIVKKL
jgi:hypothetical protein